MRREDVGSGRLADPSHEVVVFAKSLDKSTTKLAEAFRTNESLTAEFKLYGFAPDGTESHYMSYRLTGVRITAIEPYSPNLSDTSANSYGVEERIRFGYSTIEVLYVDGGATTTLINPAAPR